MERLRNRAMRFLTADWRDLATLNYEIDPHYWGYARQADGGSIEYQVEHPRWRVWRGADATLNCDVASLYGDEFAVPLSSAPASAFVAEGSPVLVRWGRRF